MGLSAEHRRVHIYDLCVYMHALESALEMGISVYTAFYFLIWVLICLCSPIAFILNYSCPDYPVLIN